MDRDELGGGVNVRRDVSADRRVSAQAVEGRWQSVPPPHAVTVVMGSAQLLLTSSQPWAETERMFVSPAAWTPVLAEIGPNAERYFDRRAKSSGFRKRGALAAFEAVLPMVGGRLLRVFSGALETRGGKGGYDGARKNTETPGTATREGTSFGSMAVAAKALAPAWSWAERNPHDVCRGPREVMVVRRRWRRVRALLARPQHYRRMFTEEENPGVGTPQVYIESAGDSPDQC